MLYSTKFCQERKVKESVSGQVGWVLGREGCLEELLQTVGACGVLLGPESAVKDWAVGGVT